MRHVLFIITLIILIGGCKTTDDSSAQLSQTQSLAPNVKKAPTFRGCPPSATCGERVDPSFCQLEVYDARTLPESERIYSWRQNRCEGLLAITRTACFVGKDPQKLDSIRCVPDSSDGQCPHAADPCTKEFLPSSCSALKYGSQALSKEQQLSATGNNECEARNALLNHACRRNLNPKLLGHITCEETSQTRPDGY